MKKCIGVLGGLGPDGTTSFYQALINEYRKRVAVRANNDYPHIIVNSIPAPELFVGEPDLKEYYRGLDVLNDAGATMIVIACNTAYVFLDDLQAHSAAPIISLQDATSGLNEDCVVFGTQRTVDALFNAVRTRLTDEELARVEFAIFEYNIGKKEDARAAVISLAKRYAGHIIIAACTEVAEMLRGSDVPHLNTMDALAASTIERYLS